MNEQKAPEQITIASEDDAWNTLARFLNEHIDDDIELVFKDWPVIEIKMKSNVHKGSLTAKNMAGMIELQKSIFRSYALIIYNDSRISSLTDLEKERLNVVFSISEGSSDIVAKLEDQIDAFAKDMRSKMQPKHYVITALGAGLIWAGYASYGSWLQHNKELFIAEQQTKEKQIEIDARNFVSEQETKRMELLTNAFSVQPKLENIQENVDAARFELFKGLSDADSVSIAGIKDLQGDTIQTILKQPRTSSVEDRLDGIFRIIKVDSSKLDHFGVTLRNICNGEVVTAKVKDTDIIQDRRRVTLQDAEWRKEPLLVQMNIKRHKGRISDAIILRAEKPTDDLLEIINSGATDIKVRWDSKKGFIYDTPKT